VNIFFFAELILYLQIALLRYLPFNYVNITVFIVVFKSLSPIATVVQAGAG
jgi:hypothetical protein